MKRINPRIGNRARELRTNQTSTESILWQHLRNRNLNGWKFRRQTPIGAFIVDFCCHEKWLVVEVDGDTHAERERYDANRTAWLESQGYRVIRFSNNDVKEHIDSVVVRILEHCEGYGEEPDSSPHRGSRSMP